MRTAGKHYQLEDNSFELERDTLVSENSGYASGVTGHCTYLDCCIALDLHSRFTYAGYICTVAAVF